MNEITPVVICHPACSGGSLIFRVLCAQFGLTGISEKSHAFPHGNDVFLPSDPEHALLIDGTLTLEEYGEIYFDRLMNTVAICSRKNQQILLREHTHSYFFTDGFLPDHPSHPSWFVQECLRKGIAPPKCIVTVRNPIDSWLSLEKNFPKLKPKNFDTYCKMFLSFMSTTTSEQKTNILLLRYEDLIGNADSELRKVAEFIGKPFQERVNEEWKFVASSGNSGRQSIKIGQRKRRPFDRKLISSAKHSDAYAKLIEILNYESLEAESTRQQHLRSFFVSFERLVATGLHNLWENLRKWLWTKTRKHVSD